MTPQHLEVGGEALLWTLERALDANFTPEVRHAWATVYGVLIATMRDGTASLSELEHRPVPLAAD